MRNFIKIRKNENVKFQIFIKYCFILFICIFLNSCVRSRLLKNNEFIYAGASIKIVSDTAIEGKRKLAGLLKDETYPLPNSKTAGLPIKLWIYSVFGPGYIGDNYGERPVLMKDVPMNEVSESLQTVLRANGYLDSKVNAKVKKVMLFKYQRKIVYSAYVGPPYFLRNITYNIPGTAISFLLDSLKRRSRLKENDQYNLVKLKMERERIDRILKNRGYYYFSPNYLFYIADSAVGNRKIDLSLQLRKNVPPSHIKPWTIKEVIVTEASKDTLVKKDTVYKGINFHLSKNFNYKRIGRFILFKEDELLTNYRYNTTNRNLSSLGALLYVNIDAIPDSVIPDKLSVLITLTPRKRNRFVAEAELVSKSNNFAGPNVGLSYINRNLFGGSEQLTIKVKAGIEAWLSDRKTEMLGDYTYELGTSIELKYPRLLFFNPNLFSANYIPSNHIRLDTRYINQSQYYRMSFINAIYGFRWRETDTKHHEFNLADINYQHTIKRTEIYDSLININPLLKQSFADQFIIGSNYSYQYSVPERDRRAIKTAFYGMFDVSGNLLYALQKAFGMKKNNEPLKFLGTPYSQYVRLIADYRVYFRLFRNDNLAVRTNIGVGIPVGNSTTLPALKQFYLGGANTIRAFQFRSVGPGAYSNTGLGYSVLVNHTGELELLANIENRWRFAKRLELALFLDAGNIWLIKDDPLRENAQFKSNLFYKQLAMGWGYGLRYLNEFFILRLDVGVPFHSPNTIEKVSNMKPILNFAIGYPF